MPFRNAGRPRSWRPFAALAWLVLVLPFGTSAEVGSAPLFATEARAPAMDLTTGAAAESQVVEPAAVERTRIARVDYGRLDAVRDAVESGQSESLRLNLFYDVEFEASIERSAPTASGYSLSGPLRDVPFGRVVLVVNGKYTLGRVYTPEGVYAIRTTGEMQTVEQMRPEPLRCATPAPPDPPAPRESRVDVPYSFRPGPRVAGPVSKPADVAISNRFGVAGETPRGATSGATAVADKGDVVDVLVVYPSFVREIEGGYEPMLAMIDLDIATANEAYAASGVEMGVKLAAAVEVEYDRFLEERFSDKANLVLWYEAVEHLAGKDDGYLDGVHELRDRHAADQVLMHLGGEIHDEVGNYAIGGIAFVAYDVSAEALEESGFSVALSGDGTTVAHELGHNMGLLHDRHDDVGNEPFPYSHGFVYEHAALRGEGTYYNPRVYGTIMSQYSGVGYAGYVLAFSDPDRSHPEDPDLKLGVPGDEPSSAPDGPADAVRHLNEVRGILANVRARADADPCKYALSGDEGVLPATGGTYRVHVETGADCAWTVSRGEWVESVSEASGAGSGEIAYTIEANDGWERPVEVVVAGRLHTRRQAGSRPITPVCERSSEIRARLVVNHPDRYPILYGPSTPCRELNFDAAYLASVRTLRYTHSKSDRGIDGSGLRPGDFDGLTGLLELEFEKVKALPPDLFYGLNGLRILNFDTRFNEESTFTNIAPGAFRGLPGLIQLRIWGHRLDAFYAGIFEGMPRLLRLDILGKWYLEEREPPATTIGQGAFWELSNLLSLRVADHRLTPLDAGVFDELHKLTRLLLFGNSLSALPVGVFAELSKLESLSLHSNRLTALPVGVFDGLTSLEQLGLYDNRLSALEPGLFDGLAKLESLILFGNRLNRLPANLFNGLSNLKFLFLSENRLSDLKPGTFGSLSSLQSLDLNENGIATLEPGVFEGLTNLHEIFLGGNGLRGLSPGVFEGLAALWRLALWGNRLGRVPVGAFDGLDRLGELNLRRGGVTSFEPGVFDDKRVLSRMTLQDNQLRDLEPGALRGLKLFDFDLRGNPGTPFTFAPTPVALPVTEPSAGQPMEVAVEVASAAPFQVNAALSASGGSLSRREVRIAPGHVRAETAVTVTPDGDGPVIVRVDGRPSVVSNLVRCNTGGLMGLTSGYCYRGVRVAAGPPLVLYGFQDRELTLGRAAETIDLAGVFSYFLGAADYSASSSNEAVAAVAVEDGTLTVTPGATGTATVTVTATGADGETRTRHFAVTVRVPSVPLFLSGSNSDRQGFVRLINHSDRAGEVRITAIDDGGARREPVTLRVGANAVAHFNTGDLERGNAAKGLTGGIGFGEGGWRLEFESALDIEALAYVRTADGFLTGMHDLAPLEGHSHRVPIFNPAENVEQVSRLRVINPGRAPAEVTVRGVDDAGASPGSDLRFTVPVGAVREFTAADLESGGGGLKGALGDGEGKWRLVVESEAPIEAMNLLENVATGHLTNLSSVPGPPDGNGGYHVPLFPAASDPLGRQGFARVVNRSGRAGTVEIAAFDDSGASYGPLELALGAGETAHFNSKDLELGNAGQGSVGEHRDGRRRLASGVDQRSRHRGAVVHTHGRRFSYRDARCGEANGRAAVRGRVQSRRQSEPGEPAAPRESDRGGYEGDDPRNRRRGRVVRRRGAGDRARGRCADADGGGSGGRGALGEVRRLLGPVAAR